MQKIALGFIKKSELAKLYGITTKTLKSRIDEFRPLQDYFKLTYYNKLSHYHCDRHC